MPPATSVTGALHEVNLPEQRAELPDVRRHKTVGLLTSAEVIVGPQRRVQARMQ
ncbi:hypothetical protein KXV79_007808 [Aspergillus fumigatus]|nr:hypothetical protein KXX07_001008 [Aspergillus fumigatus]KAH2654211.1 hypothetical protein KXV79_007808 [Aspergillus fumigatus]